MRRLALTFIALSVSFALSAQDTKTGAVEEILGFIESSEEREVVSARLERLLLSPLDLNRAKAEDLAELPFLDDFAIRALLLYRSKHAGFRNVYELKNIPGMPTRLLPLLEPFLTVGPSPYEDSMGVPSRQSLLLGTSTTVGGQKEAPALMFRYERAGRAWGWHLSGEKDRGEPWLPLRKGAFDFLSGGLHWDNGRAQALLGDFRISTGEGLILGQSLSYFSSIVYRQGVSLGLSSLRPHRSFRETGFLRGLAGKISIGDFSFMAFMGYEPVDARIEKNRILTLYPTGLHRKINERRHRHTARREAIGGYFSYGQGDGWHIGMTAMEYRYKRRIDGTRLLPPLRENRKNTPVLASMDVRYKARDWEVFLESTVPSRKERLALQGGAAYRNERLGTFTFQGRWLGAENYTPYGRPDGYTGTGRDEKGFRLIWHGEVARWTTGTIYLDRFRRISDGAKVSTVLTAKVTYREDESLLTAYARFFRLQNRPKRWMLTLQGRKRVGERLILSLEPRFSKSEGKPWSRSVASRLRYAYEPFVCDLSAQYFDLKGSAVLRGYLPYMPLMYGSPMLRNEGWFFSGGMRYAVSESLRLNIRASHLYYIRGTLPKSTLVDASLSLKF